MLKKCSLLFFILFLLAFPNTAFAQTLVSTDCFGYTINATAIQNTTAVDDLYYVKVEYGGQGPTSTVSDLEDNFNAVIGIRNPIGLNTKLLDRKIEPGTTNVTYLTVDREVVSQFRSGVLSGLFDLGLYAKIDGPDTILSNNNCSTGDDGELLNYEEENLIQENVSEQFKNSILTTPIEDEPEEDPTLDSRPKDDTTTDSRPIGDPVLDARPLPTYDPDTTLTGAEAKISQIYKFIYPIAVIIAIIRLLICILSMSQAVGDPQKLQESKECLSSTIIGLVVILAAVTVVTVLGRALGI